MLDIKSSITETHENWHRGHIAPWWTTDSYTNLTYTVEPFNNTEDLYKWQRQGYVHPVSHYTGAMCDMRRPQPEWNSSIIDWFSSTYGAKNVGSSYYRMGTGVILPVHGDIYVKYRSLFNVSLAECFRAVIFLEDWQSGHISEVDGTPVTNWKAGDYLFWRADTEHLAANIGITKRYTLQLTGHDA